MKFFALLLCTLLLVSCARQGYFPAAPTTTAVRDPVFTPLGFVTDVPEGWVRASHTLPPNGRSITYGHPETSSLITLSLSTSVVPMTIALRDAASASTAFGWKPGAIMSAGAQGSYFFSRRSSHHRIIERRFVGARTFSPCGQRTSCTVTVDAIWPYGADERAHDALRTVTTSLRFLR